MKLKNIGQYKYNNNKVFPLYQDEKENKYILKTTAIENYNILCQISDIAETSDHLLPINGFYKSDDKTISYFIALLKGETLSQVINKKEKFSIDDIKQFIYQICLGLKELHESNILHRDIKPDNIMLLPGNKIILIDYDISRTYKEEKSSDTTSSGTRGYAAPEQYGFMQTDIRSDIYSLGKTIQTLVNNCCEEHYFNFKDMIEKCIMLDPNDRYNNVDEIIRVVQIQYPRFFDEQLSQIKKGQTLGLTKEQVDIYAKSKFNANQMGVIKHALDEHVDLDVINLMADECFTSKQMWQIKRGFLDGLKLGQIAMFAKPFYNPIEMSIYRTGLLHAKNSKQINEMQKAYISVISDNTFSDEQLKIIRFSIYKTFNVNLVYNIAKENNSVAMMQQIINEEINE